MTELKTVAFFAGDYLASDCLESGKIEECGLIERSKRLVKLALSPM